MKIPRTLRMNVISHWHKLFGNFSFSTQKFYNLVEQALERRNIPGLEISRVDWKEGGLFSADREYLRLTREKLTFDICAAPFGTGFFFSSRLGETSSSISFISIFILFGLVEYTKASIGNIAVRYLGPTWGSLVALAALVLFIFILRIFNKTLSNLVIMLTVTSIIVVVVVRVFLTFLIGPYSGWIIYLGVPFLLVWFLRIAASTGSANFDAALLKIPIVGSVYEQYFRPMTFYRLDLVHAYQSAVHSAVLEAIDEVTKDAKGIRPLTEEERKPIMKSLYWK